MSPRLALITSAAGIAVALGTLLLGASAPASELDEQRELFRQLYADAELGRWDAVDALSAGEREQLQTYILWPDLRAAWLRATIRKADRIREQLGWRHGYRQPDA